MYLTHKIAINFGEHITPEEAQKIVDGFCKDLQQTGAVTSCSPLENKFDMIREWARDKGILTDGDTKTQTVKLLEEAGEVAKAVLQYDQDEFEDGIGDCVVVLTSLAHLGGSSIEICINKAYNVISGRTGKMVDGDFQKEG